MAKLLGIDIGTTSVSAVLYDCADHEILANASEDHGAYVHGKSAGHREQDPQRILSCIDQVLRALELKTARLSPEGICVTGQVHGFLLVSADGVPCNNFFTWEDLRSLEPSPSGSPWIDEVLNLYKSVTPIDERTTVGPGYAAANLFVLSRKGMLPDADYCICSIQDFVIINLTGAAGTDAVTDQSCAHSTGLYLPVQKVWNKELLAAINISPHQMPIVKDSGSYCGVTVPRPNLPGGIPVYTGLGDNQAAFLASVQEPAETVLVNVGTGSQVSVWVPAFAAVQGIDTRPYLDGAHLLVGAPLCGGRAFSQIKDFIGRIGTEIFGRNPTADELYEKLVRTVRYDTDLVCRTTFAGTRTNPDERGLLANISNDNLTVGDLTASVLHGIARELHELFRLTGAQCRRLVGTGNAVRKNPVLRRCIADRFRMDLAVPPYEEVAALGAALVAGVGCGAFESFHDAAGETAGLVNCRKGK